jgi:hypothetical protein
LRADRPHISSPGPPFLRAALLPVSPRETPGILGKRTLVEQDAQGISFFVATRPRVPSPRGVIGPPGLPAKPCCDRSWFLETRPACIHKQLLPIPKDERLSFSLNLLGGQCFHFLSRAA